MLKTLVHRQRSLGGAFGGLLIAGGLGVITYMLASDPGIPTDVSLLIGLIGATIVSSFLVLGYRLGIWRGGIFVHEIDGQFGLGLTGHGDTWWLPVDSVEGVRVKRADVRRQEGLSQSWSVELSCSNGVAISLLETHDEESAQDAHNALLSVGLWEKKDDDETEFISDYADRSIRFGVHRRGALQLPILLFGLSLAIIGTVFFLQMEHYFVFGLFFAPVIGLIGWALLAMAVVKRFGHEELIHQDGVWGHRFVLGPLSWGARQVVTDNPNWRLRVHGFRGAALELVGEDGILLMGSGATTLSRLSVAELARLPEQFASDSLG